MREAVVVDVVRTPSGRGKIGGMLSGIHPIDLLASTLVALLERTGVDPGMVEDVIGGCVTQTGQQGANITLDAMSAGAVAIITKPTVKLKSFLEESAAELIQEVRAAAAARMGKLKPAAAATMRRV